MPTDAEIVAKIRNETTSAEVARIASRALRDPLGLKRSEILKLAASCLTQAKDRPLPKATIKPVP